MSERDFVESEGVEVVKVVNSSMIVVLDKDAASRDVLRMNRTREKRYTFDNALGETCTTREVYEISTQHLVDGVMDGENATVFAYGATGTGKTHTMIGYPGDPGIMVLTLIDLFRHMETRKMDSRFTVKMSYLEIYNELIKDLIEPGPEALELREDPVRGSSVSGLSVRTVKNSGEVMDLLRRGNKHRTSEHTGANEVSSRSHAVLQVWVEQKDRTVDIQEQVRIGKLSLIDLAGSERASRTNNRGLRMIEGANINRSLLSLGNCINALGEKKGLSFVPYRDSKLTRLLKDSLGGNCRTSMIATISPSVSNFEESVNTLKYANRAKNIKTKVTANIETVSHHIAKYLDIISELRAEIAELRVGSRARTLPPPPPPPPPPPQRAPAEGAKGAPGATAKGPPSDEEKGEMERLRQKINANFNARMAIRREVLQLDESESRARMEVERVQNLVHIVGSRAPGSTILRNDASMGLPQLRAELSALNDQVIADMEAREQCRHRLQGFDEEAKVLLMGISTRIASPERRRLMELEFQMHLTELENMELEEHNNLHDEMMRERENQVARMEAHIRLQSSVIEAQTKILQSSGASDEGLAELLKQLLADRELLAAEHGVAWSRLSTPAEISTGTGGGLESRRNSGHDVGPSDSPVEAQPQAQAQVRPQAQAQVQAQAQARMPGQVTHTSAAASAGGASRPTSRVSVRQPSRERHRRLPPERDPTLHDVGPAGSPDAARFRSARARGKTRELNPQLAKVYGVGDPAPPRKRPPGSASTHKAVHLAPSSNLVLVGRNGL